VNPAQDRTREIRAQFRELAELADAVSEEMAPDVEALVEKVLGVFGGGGKLLFAGNGGSAADAQHLAAEYVVRFSRARRPLPAIALTTDSSVLTAESNDNGFETVFSRQVQALGRPGDLLVLHSTSGESENLIRAAVAARDVGMASVAFLARGGGRLKDEVDQALLVPTDVTARAQELHMIIGHVVCDLVEKTIEEEG
jgi:D-sedoheptulose 7-phosphate isomerase